MRVAFGLKARTGRAILVAVGADVHEPRFVERSQMPLLPDDAWAPYHAAEGLDAADARASVKNDIASARRLATSGIRDAAKRIAAAGHEVCGCAVLIGTGMPDWSTEQILAVHVRMHKAEGELFRDVLVAGAHACDLPLVTLAEKSALDDAANALGLSRARLDAHVAALGKSAGPPWGKDQRKPRRLRWWRWRESDRMRVWPRASGLKSLLQRALSTPRRHARASGHPFCFGFPLARE